MLCIPSSDGAIAQLGERVLCKHEVVGSIPSGSTRRRDRRRQAVLCKNSFARRAPSMKAACGWTMIRKTSLLRKINPMMRRSSFTKKDIYNSIILR